MKIRFVPLEFNVFWNRISYLISCKEYWYDIVSGLHWIINIVGVTAPPGFLIEYLIKR